MTSIFEHVHADEWSLENVTNLVALLRMRAGLQPDDTAYIFLGDGEKESARLSFSELDRRARSIAENLQDIGAQGQRALLLYPPGLDYIEAFFGCLYAGVAAVPAYPPSGRHLQRLQAIFADAAPAAIMTTLALHERFGAEAEEKLGAGKYRWSVTDRIESDGADWRPIAIDPDRLAFLQYTSGSTGDPRGVMVSHGNLLANQALIKESFRHSERSTLVGWLPLYHDMGLIGNILQPLYVGATAVLMSPMAFLEKPIRWLRAISAYRARTSGGPNFAYDLCARKITAEEKRDLDLSCWTIAFSGAEPVRAATLDRFASAFAECGFQRDSFFPCYGLAEATLVVTAPTRRTAAALRRVDRTELEANRIKDATAENAVSVVGCGRVWPGHEVMIVDPHTTSPCDDGTVGEIWVAGPSVAQGYWNRPSATESTFRAQLSGEQTRRFMRTGDLGFLDKGELFITGRLKDLIIVGGRNYYPQDFENVIDDEVEEARPGCSAAFSVTMEEQEALVVVVEPQRSQLPALRENGAQPLFRKIRECLAIGCDIAAAEIVLVQPGSVPKTSSGKIRRAECRRNYLDGELQILARTREGQAVQGARRENAAAPVAPGSDALLRDALSLLAPAQRVALVARFLISTAARLLRVPESDLSADAQIMRSGLDSLRAVELKHALDALLGMDAPLSLLLSDMTFGQAAEALCDLQSRKGAESPQTGDSVGDDGLSHTQRAMWAVHQLEPSSVAYNLHLALRIEGAVDSEALEASLTDLLERHPVLRSVYALEGDDVVQSTLPVEATRGYFSVVDAARWTSDELQQDMGLQAVKPFDLGSGPVLRSTLYRHGDDGATLLLCAHHIALDLWSLLIVLNELQIIYASRRAGRRPDLPALAAGYGDFASWQRRYMRSEASECAWAYWRDRLRGELPVLAFPVDHPRSSEPRHLGSSFNMRLDARLALALEGLAQANGVTLFSLLLAAYKVLLYRHTHQPDIIVGTASSGRSQGRFKGVVGNFVNPLALRTRLAPQKPFSDYLRDVHANVVEALAHQDFPFSELVERLQPERVAGQWPVFQTWFALQQAQSDVESGYAQLALGEESDPLPWGELTIAGLALEARIERFDLKLMAAKTRDGLALSFQYRRDLFEDATIANLSGRFRALLDAIVAAPRTRIAALPLLTPRDIRREGEQSPAAEPAVWPEASFLHRLVSSWAEKTPDAVAVAGADTRLTYAELDARANRLAHFLRGKGVDRNVAVGLCVTRSAETIVALLGILKAGGAYIPIDPDLPPTRIAAMLKDAGAGALLCRQEWFERSNIDFNAPVFLDGAEAELAAQPSVAPAVVSDPLDLAYVIFTSGSSGLPKGVAVAHGSLVNYTRAILERLGNENGLHFALVSTLAADLGHTVVFPALASGGCLHVLSYDEATDPRSFATYLANNPIDVLKIVPSHYSALLPPVGGKSPLPRKALIFGGEALPTRLAKQLAAAGPACRLFNHYGPTETTVGALMLPLSEEEHRVDRGAIVPIGRPIENMRAYILGPDLAPAPQGASGEICLSGAGLARGYIGRPDLTAERFVPDPFGASGERLYRTGDLGRLDDDGVVTFLGRIDQQIKIRGYRVELGEIEARLREHTDVEQAVVATLEEVQGSVRLVAYVVGRTGAEPSGEAMRAHLDRSLPAYMIPAAFVSLDALPVTSNGKVDRKRLPAPMEGPASERAYRAPRGDIEERLAGIYADLLGVDRVGIDDNFFSLGGDSILSIQAASRAYAAGLAVSPSQIFRHQSIAELARAITPHDGRSDGERPSDFGVAGKRFPLSTLGRRELDGLGAALSEIEDVYPLTPLQEGLLFHTLSQPNSGVYVMQHRYWIEGDIDVDVFRRAWQAVADVHPIFRTSFVWEDLSSSQQIVHRRVELPFDYSDWRELNDAERESRLDVLLAEERSTGFDLGRAPLARIRLFRLEDRRYLLIRSHHHILFDAWCTSLILRELQSNYESLLRRRAAPASAGPGFRDYIAWLQRQDAGAAEPFWRDYLRGFDEPTPFFASRANSDGGSGAGAIEDIVLHLSEDDTARLKQLSQRFRVTPNTFAQAALALLLAHYTSRREVVFGVTVSGRPADLPQVESILGLFINGLPLRVAIDPSRSLASFLEMVLEHNYAIRDYEYVSLTQIQDWSEIPRGVELFQYLLTFENAPVDPALLESRGQWRFTDCWHRTHTNYPITFVVIPGQRLHLQLTYARDRVDAAAAQRLLSHYRGLLEEMVRRPEARLGELAVLRDEERRLLLEGWNETAHHYAEPRDIIGRFEAQARRRPDAVAVRCDGATLTYRELGHRADRVASALIGEGVKPDDIVALLDERGLDFLVTMLGVFKAGAGYLPLDPAYPDGRIAQVLDEARVGWLLAGRAHHERAGAVLAVLEATRPRLLSLAALEARGGECVGPARRYGPNNLAFVIYTSGSTGKPKGAVVEHRGMFNNLITKERALGLTVDDVIAQTASQCFDISVWQFLTALALGARVEIFRDDISRDPQRLLKEIEAAGVTILEAVPSMIRALLDASEMGRELATLRWLLPCGEAFTPELCRRFMERFPHVRLLNAYGPAECSDDVSYYPIETPPEGNDLSVPIGRPVDNTRLYILDRWLEPAPIGAAGEICVAGIQVGRGYLNRPDLTAAAFLPDPFGPAGGRLYRTGDLGRYRADGVIEFLGRVDHQVKIRGNRIEPGEIEARLSTHPEVQAVCVLARQVSKGVYRLIAYVVSAVEAFAPDELRRHLRGALPDYMIPEAFVRLDALPLSPNGKIDRKALPAHELDIASMHRYVAPRSPTEETIAQIWMDILDVPRVGAGDNFFELGGHSLVAARIVSRVRSIFAIELPLRLLLETADLAEFAARIDEARGRPGRQSLTPLIPAARDEAIALSNAQKRLWFMQRMDHSNTAYHSAVAARVFGPLDDDLFEASLNAIIRRHESLRTVFAEQNGFVRQQILTEAPIALRRESLEIDQNNSATSDLRRRMKEFIATPFDLAHGPLVRAALFDLPAGDGTASPTRAIVLCFHHIIFDGWSFGLFLKEFAAIYSAIRDGRELSLPRLPIQYADYAVWHAEQMRDERFLGQLAYWAEHLKGAPAHLELLADRPRTPEIGGVAGSHVIDLSELRQSFDSFNRQRAVTPFMTFLSAFAVLLRYLSGSSDLVIGTDVANRPRSEFETVIGFFVNLVALRIRLDGDPSFSQIVDRIRDVTLSTYDHQTFPFDKLVEALRPERSPLHSPIFQVKLAFHNFPLTELDIADLQFEQIVLESQHAELDLVLHVHEWRRAIRVVFEYRAGLFEAATIGRNAELFRSLLRCALTEPEIGLGAMLALVAEEDRAIRDAVRSEQLTARHGRLRSVKRRSLPGA
ncbi:non-ribosomal peptide synthetase [Methylosinus sp. KRF6]|uniref:non-ribosomal peptide synthetase n=1 Tax=Methylosinus sp. KRF6 TaxID=2846853 RepID=UPI001C0B059B|nr:non-ribosomal peptide synthetase [Methylosinus sp. KRF6]MBU3890346.1 amino acid adenylation domain-containing protein [Methylosinus sp. KRF6]